jgi:hypothetical protein
MKNRLLLITMLLFATLSYSQNKKKSEDPNVYRIADMTVLAVYPNETLLFAQDHGKRFRVVSDPNLMVGMEYRFYLILDKATVEKLECSGCNPTYDAKIFGYEISSRQNAINRLALERSFKAYLNPAE